MKTKTQKPYVPAVEALYHSIGYALKGYKTGMKSVSPIATGYNFEKVQIFHPNKVSVKLEQYRKKLLKIFNASRWERMNDSDSDAELGTIPRPPTLIYVTAYMYAAKDKRTIQSQVKHLEFQMSVVRNAIKASETARKELAMAISDYEKSEGVKMAELPKALQALPAKVDKQFAALHKKATSMLAAFTKKHASCKKSLQKMKA